MTNKIQLLGVAIIMTAIFTHACTVKEMDGDNNPNLIETHIKLSGVVSSTESPLPEQTKAGSGDDLVGLQIYEDGQPFAYGLFDDINSDISLYLDSRKVYKFVCTRVIGNDNDYYTSNPLNDLNFYTSSDGIYFLNTGDELGYEYYNKYNSYRHPLYIRDKYGKKIFDSDSYVFVLNDGYGFPFVRTYSHVTFLSYKVKTSNKTTVDDYEFQHIKLNTDLGPDFYCSAVKATNRLTDSSTEEMAFLSEPYVGTYENNSYSAIERFYGECNDFIPEVGKSAVINLKGVYFKLQYSITGITDGYVSLTIGNGEKQFVAMNNLSSSYSSEVLTFCFNNIKDAWQYDDYMENLTVSMKWMRGIGIEQDLGSQVIQVKRNALNNITINLNTN